MSKLDHIALPKDENDHKAALRVINAFVDTYQPAIIQAQEHLQKVIKNMEPGYAAAYKPWFSALNDISKGIQLLAKKIPLPDMDRFIDALHMFTFDGAVQFLFDLCRNSKMALERDWPEKFRQHIDALLFSISILNRQLAPSAVR
jgi:hypothetical protein